MSASKTIPDPDRIDPARIPQRTLHTGARMPAIGLGTFGSDHVPAEAVGEAVREAVALGYRHIDCASVYGNEVQIGDALRRVCRNGVAREELFITSKLWNDMHGPGDVLLSCARSLRDLGLEYLDLFLVHWPYPNHHAPGVDVGSRDPHAVPYIHEQYMETWRQMERLVDAGLVRHIGTSNMTVAKLRRVLRDARIPPAANEMELHPHFQQPALFDFCIQNRIVPVGYSPLGSPGRPERDRTPEDTVDLEDPVLVGIARSRGVHPAAVCIRWAVQRGQVPIPFSTRRTNLLSNLTSAAGEPLTDAEMAAIGGIDRDCRLIKGQVFLWEGARDWPDLWDESGSTDR